MNGLPSRLHYRPNARFCHGIFKGSQGEFTAEALIGRATLEYGSGHFAFTLHSRDVSNSHTGRQPGVFAVSFEDSPAERRVADVCERPENLSASD